MPTDITTKDLEIIPAKEKVQVIEDNFQQTMGGLRANPTSIERGAGDNLFRLDDQGLYMGNADFASAPFSVTYAGVISATGLDLTAYFHKTNDDLDDVIDGSTYSKVLTTSISAGKILLSQADGDSDDISEGAANFFAGVSGADFIKGTDDLDDISDGSTYAKVLSTSISAGQIILGQATGDLDDIADGGTYGKILVTDISAGKIVVVGSTASININDTTFGNAGIQLQYNGGTPRAYVGDGANAFFQHDGTKITWKAANAELDASGNLSITGGVIEWATISGTTNAPEDDATVGGTIGTDIKDEDSDVSAQDKVVNFKKYVLGETISTEDVICIKPDFEDFSPSKDTYVDSNLPVQNFGSDDEMYASRDGGGIQDRHCFIEFDMSSVPSPEFILKAEIILTVKTRTNTPEVGISDPDAAWVEGTITWNTMPATSALEYGDNTGTFVVGAALSTLAIDITRTVRKWKNGSTNNGLRISENSGGNSDISRFYTEDEATSSRRPVLRIYKTNDTDGKIYKADCSDYLLSRSIIGFAEEAGNLDDTKKVQIQGVKDGFSFGTTRGVVYLNNTAGSITEVTNNLERVIGVGDIISASEIQINLQRQNILIEKLGRIIQDTSGTVRVFVPSDARWAKVYMRDNSTAPDVYRVIDTYRDNDGLDSLIDTYYDGSAVRNITCTWGANYIDITGSTADLDIFNIYFYT